MIYILQCKSAGIGRRAFCHSGFDAFILVALITKDLIEITPSIPRLDQL